MMKFLGIIDLVIALMFFSLPSLPKQIILVAATYLIVKGIIFGILEDYVSYVDTVIGVYLIFAAFGIVFGLVSIVAAVFLAQKGLLSLI